MASVNIPATLIGGPIYTGLHASAAKLTNICDAKTAAVYAAANQATQVLYLSLAPPASHFAITAGGVLLAGYLGGTLTTQILCQREITVKEACILTGVSTIQGAIIGGILGGIVGGLMSVNQ